MEDGPKKHDDNWHATWEETEAALSKKQKEKDPHFLHSDYALPELDARVWEILAREKHDLEAAVDLGGNTIHRLNDLNKLDHDPIGFIKEELKTMHEFVGPLSAEESEKRNKRIAELEEVLVKLSSPDAPTQRIQNKDYWKESGNAEGDTESKK